MQKIILISLALIALINAQMQMQNTLNVTFNNEVVIVQWNYAPESIEFHVIPGILLRIIFMSNYASGYE